MKNITYLKTTKIMLLIVTFIFSFQRCNSENNRAVKFIVLEGNKFRDLNKNGNLDPYEDWRLSVDKRIDDLISKMTLDEKVGLMFPTILDIDKNGELIKEVRLGNHINTSDAIIKRKINHV